MKSKHIVNIALLGFIGVSLAVLAAREMSGRTAPDAPPPAAVARTQDAPITVTQAQAAAPRQTVVYYFHGNKRCKTCRAIEAYTAEAIQGGFARELAGGRMVFRAINVDEPANEHFVRDFQLSTRSVVVADTRDGAVTDWRNLERVWELTGDKGAFVLYIQQETSRTLQAARP
jgi:hypothetical protein